MGKSKKEKKEKKKKEKKKEKKDKSLEIKEHNIKVKVEKSSQNGDISLPVEDEEKLDKGEDKNDRPDYDELIQYVTVISKPLAGKKLTKRLYKTVKKASKIKTLRRGVKEVSKAIRKGEKGFVVIAGDIAPIDVISHLPVMCEDRDLPYAYVPSKMDLGIASLTKRPTSVVMVKRHTDIADNYDKCFSKMKALPLPI